MLLLCGEVRVVAAAAGPIPRLLLLLLRVEASPLGVDFLLGPLHLIIWFVFGGGRG